MSSTPQIHLIEHIVLFKVKDNTDSNTILSAINSLNSLVNINQILHLSASPIHKFRSSSASASAFTHVLHSRCRSKDDLNAYASHPDHIRVIKDSLPIFEDIMAVDWIADRIPGNLVPPPGSVAQIRLIKLKENLPDERKTEIMEVIKEEFASRGIDDITVGENFSMARSKGFSIASIAVFQDLGELEAHKELQNEKIGEYIDDTIIVEFKVPSSTQPL